MQIILLDKVVNLGNLGEIVKVKDGYARNFLIPAGRARRATEAAKAEFEAKRAELEKAAAAKLAEAQAKGWRGRSSVWFRDQPRHRRRAEQARLQGCQVANPPAQRPDQGRERKHCQCGSAHRCGGGRDRVGLRRNSLRFTSVFHAKPPSGGFCFCAALVCTWLPTGCPNFIHRLVP